MKNGLKPIAWKVFQSKEGLNVREKLKLFKIKDRK